MRSATKRSHSLIWAVALPTLACAMLVGTLTWWLREAVTWRDADRLWFLALAPLFTGLLLTAWFLRQRTRQRFGSATTSGRLIAGRSGVWRATRGILLVVGTMLLVIALAGPQYGSRTRVLRKRGVDVVVALDFSKSMLARDVRPDRIRRAKAELMRLVEESAGDRVGLVAFAGETIEFPMTADYAALGLFLRDLGPYDMPVGGTAIGRALISAKRLLERSRGSKREERDSAGPTQLVVLLTDGEDHEGDPLEAARELAEAGIRVYAVGIGSASGEPIPTYATDGTWTGYLRDDDGQLVTTALTPENEKALREIASATGGRYFRARAGDVGISQIRREMRAMKQHERKTRRVTVNEERYALILLPAFLLLLLESLLPESWFQGRRRRRDEANA